jgi:hypothetical protein
MIGSEGVAAKNVQAAPVFPDNGQPTPPRQWSRREIAIMPVLPDFKVAADEGSLFTGTNAAFGTGVLGPSAAAFSATSAILSLANKASSLSAQRTFLAYLRLILTAAPTSGTRFDVAVTTDTIVRGSAGTTIALANAAMVMPITVALYNPTVAAASGAVVNQARATVKVAAPVVGDEYLFVFGAVEMAGALVPSAAIAARHVVPMPPVVIGPGAATSALIHLWSVTSSTAPSFEFELGLIER